MTVNVTHFSEQFGMTPEVPVVHAAVTYDCPITGNSKILIINNTLYIREMEHNLLPLIMMRLKRTTGRRTTKIPMPKSYNRNSFYLLPH